MLSCMMACTMRSIGVSENECLGHCDRHGQSGCSLTVNEETFKLCGPRDIRGSQCAGPVSQSDCELGCQSYPKVNSRYETREMNCPNVNPIANPGRMSTIEDCQAACDDRHDCGAIQVLTRSINPANNCLLYPKECNENRVDGPCTAVKECFYFERVTEITLCTLSGGDLVFDGWSGNDSGENSCNTCSCESGTLTCTEMACGPTAGTSTASTSTTETCKGNPDTFNAGFGSCETYGLVEVDPITSNTNFCDVDQNEEGLVASEVCAECGKCIRSSATPAGPSPHEQLKMKVKAAFDVVKSPERKNALPGLIRKAFHDAGHFDIEHPEEARMGCIQHFLAGENFCPQHGHLEEAESVVKDVMAKVDMELSMADAVQLLGALAVDELAKVTGAAPLYERVRTGRIDPAADTCIGKKKMCNILPAFATKGHSSGQFADHQSIVDGLEDVFESEIRGKMIQVNTFSKQEAVALIGAHTVGRHFAFGHWTQQPFIFDNEYFVHLKRAKDWIDQGNTFGQGNEEGRPFGESVFRDWFQDTKLVQDPDAPLGELFKSGQIMMLDADLTLVLNAPNLVESYATDGARWRRDFDDAYIKMSELGFASLEPPLEENRRLLQRSEGLLDEEFEFFQNLRILQQEQMKKIHGAFNQKA